MGDWIPLEYSRKVWHAIDDVAREKRRQRVLSFLQGKLTEKPSFREKMGLYRQAFKMGLLNWDYVMRRFKKGE